MTMKSLVLRIVLGENNCPGSSDTSVSVWTLKGDHVGTFGQRHGYFKHVTKSLRGILTTSDVEIICRKA